MSDLLQISFQAGALAALVLLTNQMLSKWLPPKARYTLWFLVVIRLLLWTPLSDPLAMERPDWWTWDQKESPAESVEVTLSSSDEVAASGGIAALMAPPASEAKIRFTSNLDEEENGDGQPKLEGMPDPIPAVAEESTAVMEEERPRPKRRKADSTPIAAASMNESADGSTNNWLFAIWLIGAVAMLLRAIGSEWNLRRRLRSQGKPAPIDAQQMVEQCRALCGIDQTVDVIETDLVSSPAAYGLLRPKILLPIGGWRDLDADERELVILHELAHLKHKDAWTNWLMALLAAVHWFNPLVHIAFARLRAEREVVRDCEAIAARPGVEPTRYAATILKMVPRVTSPQPRSSLSAMVSDQKTTRKRITMIMKNQSFKKPHLLLGATVFALLGWVGLTQASVSEEPQNSEPTESVDALLEQQSIRVTRQAPEPEWRPALQTQLETEVDWSGQEMMIDEWVEQMRDRYDVDLYFEDAPIDTSYDLFVPTNPMSLRTALDLICWSLPYNWYLTPEGIKLNDSDDPGSPLELRFYDIRPLAQGDHERADMVMSMLFDSIFGIPYGMKPMIEVWRDGTDARYWDGQLLIKQNDEIHGNIEDTLNLLLAGESSKGLPISDHMKAALKQPIHIKEEDFEAHEFFQILSEQTGTTILLHPDEWGDEFGIQVVGATLQEVLDTISRRMDLNYQIWDNAVLFGHTLPMEVRSYPIGDLIHPSEEWIRRAEAEIRGEMEEVDEVVLREELESYIADMTYNKMDELEDLLYTMVAPETWDEMEGARLVYWDDRIIVRQLTTTHDSIQTFLQAARRATQ